MFMADTKSSGKLLLHGLISVLLLFGLVEIIVNAKGLFLHLELAGLVLLIVLSFLGLAGYKSYGERVLFLVFLLYMANLVLIWHFYSLLYFVLLLISLVGLLMSFPRSKKKGKKSRNPVTNEPASVVFDNTPKVEIVHDEPKKEEKKEKKQEKPKVKHSPGKYVASKRSNIYHEPKCDWAKKIKKDRQLWFPEKKDAQKKGYRKHSCVN